LKQIIKIADNITADSMNKQNPDRGIETNRLVRLPGSGSGMNKQNPDRGIETGLPQMTSTSDTKYEQTESRPRD